MSPEPEKDILGENLRRALGACDEQVDRSYAEFLRRLEGRAAPTRRPALGWVAIAASLLVCAGVLAVILSTGGSRGTEDTLPGLAQDEKGKKPPPTSDEQSLQAQIAFQENLLEKTEDAKDRALVLATIKTLRAELARVQKSAGAKGEKKGGPDPMEDLNRQLKEKPNNVDLHLAVAEMYLKTKKWDEALSHARKAAELAPDRAKAHLLAGRASQLIKQTDEADKAFARALELDPKLADEIQSYRNPPPAKGKTNTADDRAAKLRAEQDSIYMKIKNSKDPDEQAKLEMRAKEIGQELKLLEQGSKKEVNTKDVEMRLQKNPDDVEALVDRGRYFVDQGKGAEALKDLDRAIAIKPEFARAYLTRAIAHALTGNMEKANADVKKGQELDPAAKKDIEYAWGALKKLGQGSKESPKSSKESIERQVSALKDRLDELKAMEANVDLSAEERAKAGKEAARVQAEIEKLKGSATPEKKKP